MKIEIISDIHNNVIALNRVLIEFDRQKIDGIICSGDVIGIGPYPEETVQKIMSLQNILGIVQGKGAKSRMMGHFYLF